MSESHRKMQVTLPGLSFKKRTRAFVRIDSKIHQSERIEEGSDNRKAALTCRVTNLQDNKQYTLICPALMVSAMSDLTEDYVGKCYEIEVSAKPKPGKQYKEVSVWEIDCKTDYTAFPVERTDGDDQDEE